jgi:hypothetical protein
MLFSKSPEMTRHQYVTCVHIVLCWWAYCWFWKPACPVLALQILTDIAKYEQTSSNMDQYVWLCPNMSSILTHICHNENLEVADIIMGMFCIILFRKYSSILTVKILSNMDQCGLSVGPNTTSTIFFRTDIGLILLLVMKEIPDGQLFWPSAIFVHIFASLWMEQCWIGQYADRTLVQRTC